MDRTSVVLLICFLYFMIMIIAGVYVSARNKKTSDYLLAGRKLNLPFTIATLSAVQIGAGVILGGSANGAQTGVWPGMWYALGCGGGLILPGGFLNDWKLKSNIDGLYIAGDSLYASNCYGHAAATGYYAGRHASKYASETDIVPFDRRQAEDEMKRIYAPLYTDPETALGWKELNMGIAKTMQNYCGEFKRDELLKIGLMRLDEYEMNIIPATHAFNPHELVRLLEVFDILTVSQIILHSCLARKTSTKSLCFERGDSIENNTGEDRKLITVKRVNDGIVTSDKPVDFFGDLKENYEKNNQDYIKSK